MCLAITVTVSRVSVCAYTDRMYVMMVTCVVCLLSVLVCYHDSILCTHSDVSVQVAVEMPFKIRTIESPTHKLRMKVCYQLYYYV